MKRRHLYQALLLGMGLVAPHAHAQSTTAPAPAPAPAQGTPAAGSAPAGAAPAAGSSSAPAGSGSTATTGTAGSSAGTTGTPAGVAGPTGTMGPSGTLAPAGAGGPTGTTAQPGAVQAPSNQLPGGIAPANAQQGSLGQRSTADTAALNVPGDNAQLDRSLTGQNSRRQGGLGAARDNALAERERQNVQFAGAPDSAVPGNARNAAVFGQPAQGSAQTANPANQGPQPGSDVVTATGEPAPVYEVRPVIPQPSATGGVAATAPAQQAPRGGRGAPASTGNSGAAPTANGGAATDRTADEGTRIYSYGPGGGDNVVGLRRLYELQGQFSFSDERRRAERRAARAEAPRRR